MVTDIRSVNELNRMQRCVDERIDRFTKELPETELEVVHFENGEVYTLGENYPRVLNISRPAYTIDLLKVSHPKYTILNKDTNNLTDIYASDMCEFLDEIHKNLSEINRAPGKNLLKSKFGFSDTSRMFWQDKLNKITRSNSEY